MTLPIQGPSAQSISPQVPFVPALFTRLHPQLVTDCPSLPVDARAGVAGYAAQEARIGVVS